MSKGKSAPPPDDNALPSDAELMALLSDTSAWVHATGTPGKKLAVKSAALKAPPGAKAFTPIPVMPLGNGLWRLDRDVQHTDPVLACTLFVKKGYEFDLASVPRPIWPVIAPFELSILAPLFHDLVYEFRGVLPAELVSPFRTFSRQEADDLFLRLMILEEVSRWKRAMAYAAVRSAGWTYWNT